MAEDIAYFNKTSIDFSKSSVEIFPALAQLDGSDHLYFKFSKNRVKLSEENAEEILLMDFDLCLIDRAMNETVLQLFAIFAIKDQAGAVSDWRNIEIAVSFARSMVIKEAEERKLTDQHGQPLTVPPFAVTPESIRLFS
jgi:hypothetical protein